MKTLLTLATLTLAGVAIGFGLTAVWLVSGPALWLAVCFYRTLERLAGE
jgi:hypothetical protein